MSRLQANEIQTKVNRLRDIMEQKGIQGLWLRGVDWFSWITGGASSVVILTNEVGVAEVFISQKEVLVLTDQIEAPRMQYEELKGLERVLEIKAFPWAEPQLKLEWITERLGVRAKIASDRPEVGELSLPKAIYREKRRLSELEILRYQKLGADAALAMREALESSSYDMTEFELAGLGAQALLSRGIEPTLVLVAGASRVKEYRHPLPTHSELGNYAMMVFCGRRHGLYANLTRFVYFNKISKEDLEQFHRLSKIESAALSMSVPGVSLGTIYEGLKEAYQNHGYENEIYRHHQGGLTGYLSREIVARRDTDFILETGNVVAWNPSLPGVKLEDTILIRESGHEILTYDSQWPMFNVEINGRHIQRPLPLVIQESTEQKIERELSSWT